MIDPVEAARQTMLAVGGRSRLPASARDPAGTSLAHAAWLLDEVRSGDQEIGKANRWLAWAQCLLVMRGVTDLDAMKSANYAARETPNAR